MPIRSLFVTLLLIIGISKVGYSQRILGIHWHAPPEISKARQQLTTFHNLGISYLEINQPLSPQEWTAIDSLHFNIYAMLPVRFPTSYYLAHSDSTLSKKLRPYLQNYLSHKRIAAIGLFSYGATQNSAFKQAMAPYVSHIRAVYDGPIYYKTTRAQVQPIDLLFDFKMLAVSPAQKKRTPARENSIVQAYFYHPPDYLSHSLQPVKWFLQNTSGNSDYPVFFNASWLKSMLSRYPTLKTTFESYAHSTQSVFPLPKEPLPQKPGHSWPTLILLICWIIAATIYYINPSFRNAVIRFFSSHPFFVDDVMKRIIRNKLPGLALILQGGLLTGIGLYILASTMFSPLGLQALASLYPHIFFTGSYWFSLGLEAFIFAVIFMLICVCWLLANPAVKNFNQVLNMYLPLLQLNLFVATFMVILFNVGAAAWLLYILGIIFAVIFFLPFLITAVDTSLYMTAYQVWFLLGTAGLYLLLLAAGVIFILHQPDFIQMVKLAASLS